MLVLPFALVALAASLVALLAARRSAGPLVAPAAKWGRPRADVPPAAWSFATLAALLACGPLLATLPTFLGPRPLLVGDAASHAAVAQELARSGLPHGWIDVYNGGFPFGIHYQSVGYFLVAALVKLGATTARATQALGIAGTVALPLVIVRVARAAGARPAAAVAGAWIVAWISPHDSFVGGWEQWYLEGLLAQTLALPLAVATAGAIAIPGPRWRAPVLAALLVATHPQIGTGLFAVLAIALAAAPGRWATRYVRAAVAGGALAVATYGHGILSLGVPFGFPTGMPEWKQIGFPPSVLPGWLFDGELFDAERPSIIGALWLASWCWLLVLAPRRRVPRAVLATSVLALVLAMSGAALRDAGRVGQLLLGFVMPLRLAALLGLSLAACVVVALEELGAWLVTLPSRRRRLAAALAAAAPLVLLAALALPSRARWALQLRDIEAAMQAGGGAECGPATPRGYATDEVTGWLRDVKRGRFTFAVEARPMGYCPGVHGVELASPVPLGACSGAATHLGTNVAAFAALRSGAPGSAARAESLGVRAILHAPAERPAPGEPWRLAHERGDVGLSVRIGGTDTVGVGCIEEAWSGEDASLRAALVADLASDDCLLDHPTRLVALEPGAGPLARAPVPRDGCDATGAKVEERPREPGAYEAEVVAPAPVDVVIRATAWRGWRVVVDGAERPWRMVAPGFLAARVPPGRHHVEAIASLPRTLLPGVAAALAVVALAATVGRRRRRA